MAFTRFAYHRRDELAEHGQFGFNLTGVEYGHDGIKNLKYNLPIPQQEWDVEVSSGTFTYSYVFDSGTSRVPLRLTSTATGLVKVYVRFQLDRDHGSFPSSAFSITIRRNQAMTSLLAKLWKGGVADTIIDGTFSVDPGLDNTWTTMFLSPGSTYTPSNWLTFELAYTADTIGDYIEIADFFAYYVTARGNV